MSHEPLNYTMKFRTPEGETAEWNFHADNKELALAHAHQLCRDMGAFLESVNYIRKENRPD